MASYLDEPSPRTPCRRDGCPSEAVIFDAGGTAAFHWPLYQGRYDHLPDPAHAPESYYRELERQRAVLGSVLDGGSGS